MKKKKDINSEENNDDGSTSKRLKNKTSNQENDKYITSSEIKELIKNSNLEELKKIFDISKFYDNKFIKWLIKWLHFFIKIKVLFLSWI